MKRTYDPNERFKSRIKVLTPVDSIFRKMVRWELHQANLRVQEILRDFTEITETTEREPECRV